MTEERKSDADVFYGSDESLAMQYERPLSDSVNHLTDVAGWTEAERASYVREAARTFHDAGIRERPAAVLHALVAKHLSEPADDVTRQRWETETRRTLREKYGLVEGDRKLANAREFLKGRHVTELLESTGVGSNPKFVIPFIEHAEKLRSKPTRPAA